MYKRQLSFEEAAIGSEHEIEFEREVECVYCGGTGAKSSDSVISCETCGGNGQVAYRQGFVTFSSQCSECGGSGKKITEHSNESRGSGKRAEECSLKIKIPAGADHESRLRLREKGEGGINGGNIIAEGKPEEICSIKGSYTGEFLKSMLNNKFKKTA